MIDRRSLLASLIALGLTACAGFQPFAPTPAPAQAQPSVAELNTPQVAGEPDRASFLEPGIQVLSQDGDASDAMVGRAIANKLRANLVLPRGSYPKSAAVTLEAALTPKGAVLGARVARSSGYKTLDEAVLKALRRAEPLPVTRSIRESDSLQRINLVFRPFQ